MPGLVLDHLESLSNALRTASSRCGGAPKDGYSTSTVQPLPSVSQVTVLIGRPSVCDPYVKLTRIRGTFSSPEKKASAGPSAHTRSNHITFFAGSWSSMLTMTRSDGTSGCPNPSVSWRWPFAPPQQLRWLLSRGPCAALASWSPWTACRRFCHLLSPASESTPARPTGAFSPWGYLNPVMVTPSTRLTS